jgi:hypothetical protein
MARANEIGAARADALAESEAERASLDALRAATGEPGGPMERHCIRQFLIAERLGLDGGLEVDREVLLCAAFIHDAGLYPGVATSGVYTHDGRVLGERTLAPFGWERRRLVRCLDAIEQHHALRARWDWGNEVELTRRSDLVEVSAGLVRYGLSRAWLRELFREIPRLGFYREVGSEAWRSFRVRPRTIPQIFRPPNTPTSAEEVSS